MQKAASFLKSTNVGKYLIPAGIILILFSLFMFYVVMSSQGYAETEAVVTRTELYEEPEKSKESDDAAEDIFDVFGNSRDKKSTVYVRYTVDGIEYEEVYGVFTGYKEGDTIKICYDPDDPKRLIQPGSLLHPTVILIVGIAAIIAGIICFRIDLTDAESTEL